jgi:hypothetical protein
MIYSEIPEFNVMSSQVLKQNNMSPYCLEPAVHFAADLKRHANKTTICVRLQHSLPKIKPGIFA